MYMRMPSNDNSNFSTDDFVCLSVHRYHIHLQNVMKQVEMRMARCSSLILCFQFQLFPLGMFNET